MPSTAIVTFTARSLEQILEDGGSQAWRLDPERARRSEFLICTRNRHNSGLGPSAVEHGHAFFIGRISEVVPSPERPDRWLIRCSEYLACDIPNIWAKSGHLRYPVWYTTLDELAIDLAALPPFQPLPARPSGMADMSVSLLVPLPGRTQGGFPLHSIVRGQDPVRPPMPAGQDAWTRFDAILAQLDRTADRPTPVEALEWDEHGLPR